MRILVGALLAFALGVAVGAAYFWKPAAAPEQTLAPELQAKFQQLTEKDLEEYYQLKTEKEKFAKADEILGKIMTIFLADLGLHASPAAIDASHRRFTPAPDEIPAAPDVRANNRVMAPPPPAPPPQGAENKGPGSHEWRQLESHLANAREDSEADPLLKKLQLTDPSAVISSSSRLTNPTLIRQLNGTFAGNAAVKYNGQDHQWQVTLELQGSLAKGQLTGTSRFVLTENGHNFSTSNGKGSQSAYHEIPDDPSTILLQAAPNVLMQLYFINDLNQLGGNVYRRDAEDRPYAAVGNVFLNKQ
jgi:hypothetical protein